MPEQIRSAYHVAARRIETRIFPKVEPPEDIILAKIEMCGVCGTDVHYWKRTPKSPHPLGHEPVYIIEEFGPNAVREDIWGQKLEVDDRILAEIPWWCGELSCPYCSFFHQEWLCQGPLGSKRKKKPAWREKIPPIAGYSNYGYIPSDSYIYKIPDTLPSKIAVLTDPLCTGLQIAKCMDRAGLTVAIVGSGPIGLLGLFAAKLAGAWRVIVTGGPENRLKLCEEFGADYTINIFEVTDPEERIKTVKKLTPGGYGPDVVLEAAGVPIAFYESIEMVRRGGTVVEVGHFTDAGPISINPHTILRKNITIRSFNAFDCEEYGYALRVLDSYRDKYPLDKVVTHIFKIEEAQQALEAAERGIPMKAVIIP